MAVYTDLDEANERVDELENELAELRLLHKNADERSDELAEHLDGVHTALVDLPNQPFHNVLDVVEKLTTELGRIV